MARPPQQIDYRLLGKVSRLYYEDGYMQREIAERLHLSRPKVSRLLNQAKEEGLVQITIIPPSSSFTELESKLETKYNLQEVVITEVEAEDPQAAVSQKIGAAAAEYLHRTQQDGDIMGISWGTTLKAMVNALQPSETRQIQIVQMIGGLGAPEAEIHATALCQRMAQILNAKLTLIPAPGIVDSQAVKQILQADSHVQAAFNLFPAINVAYVGIGAPTPDSVLISDGSIIQESELETLLQLGAVGDIALRFFDNIGNAVVSELDERVIGITLAEIAQIERVVGVTGGLQKTTTIQGALQGSWIDVLITDQITASQLLQEHL
ncbi:MAG: DNA-binding transcriptional regulator [Chloroflexi bacterium]|nr:MAG: DNA-binding transcriptional regulator [Chloroflexota bacterium]